MSLIDRAVIAFRNRVLGIPSNVPHSTPKEPEDQNPPSSDTHFRYFNNIYYGGPNYSNSTIASCSCDLNQRDPDRPDAGSC